MKPATLREFLDRFIDDTLDRCTRCGRCFEACPMIPYSERLAAARPGEVVEGVLDVLRQKPGSAGAIDWIRICTQSAVCVPACPEGINAMLMLRVGRQSALGQLGAEPAMKAPIDPLFFRRIDAFAGLQLSESEFAQWQLGESK